MATVQAARAGGKVEELESIRGLAALVVALLHFPIWNSLLNVGILRNGALMVELFFVLSGFVIHGAYENKLDTRGKLIRFQFLRFARLYPVHLLFLLAMLVIECIKYYAQTHSGLQSVEAKPFETNNMRAFIEQLLLIQTMFPGGAAGSFNTPAWSISVEFYTYLLFGAVILCLRKYANLAFFVIFGGALALLVSGNTFGMSGLLRCLAGFFLGCLVSYSRKNYPITMPNIFSLVFLVAIPMFIQFLPTTRIGFIIYFLSAGLVLSLISSECGIARRFLKLKSINWLGTVSYSMYMCHFSIIWVASQVVRIGLHRPEIMIDGRMTPQMGVASTLIIVIVTMAVVLLCSHLVYTYVEDPIRRKSRTFVFRDRLAGKIDPAAVSISKMTDQPIN